MGRTPLLRQVGRWPRRVRRARRGPHGGRPPRARPGSPTRAAQLGRFLSRATSCRRIRRIGRRAHKDELVRGERGLLLFHPTGAVGHSRTQLPLFDPGGRRVSRQPEALHGALPPSPEARPHAAGSRARRECGRTSWSTPMVRPTGAPRIGSSSSERGRSPSNRSLEQGLFLRLSQVSRGQVCRARAHLPDRSAEKAQERRCAREHHQVPAPVAPVSNGSNTSGSF
jgi:hypothetical protein